MNTLFKYGTRWLKQSVMVIYFLWPLFWIIKESKILKITFVHHGRINFDPCPLRAVLHLICCLYSQQALNWTRGRNLIHMLMRCIPMDFYLLCHRYHPQNSLPPYYSLYPLFFLSHSPIVKIPLCSQAFTAYENMNLFFSFFPVCSYKQTSFILPTITSCEYC